MSLTLHLNPDLEQRLRQEAKHRGLELEELLEQDLMARWGIAASLREGGEPSDFKGIQPNHSESALLLAATEGLPESFWQRYRHLIALREAQTLTEGERQELIALSDQAEALTVQRTRALVELARLRGVEVSLLQKQLGLVPVQVSA